MGIGPCLPMQNTLASWPGQRGPTLLHQPFYTPWKWSGVWVLLCLCGPSVWRLKAEFLSSRRKADSFHPSRARRLTRRAGVERQCLVPGWLSPVPGLVPCGRGGRRWGEGLDLSSSLLTPLTSYYRVSLPFSPIVFTDLSSPWRFLLPGQVRKKVAWGKGPWILIN